MKHVRGHEILPVRTAVVGANGGHYLQSHQKELLGESLCQVTALADTRIENLTAAEPLSALALPSWDAVQALRTIEAAVIMTGDKTHATFMAEAIQRGWHVLCEKPLFRTHEEYGRVALALGVAQAKGLVALSCHPRRFDPPFMRMKAYVDNPELVAEDFGVALPQLGKPQRFAFDFSYPEPRADKAELHDSLRSDHLCHEIETMDYLFGPSNFNIWALGDGDSNPRAYRVAGQRHADGLHFRFAGTRTKPATDRAFEERMTVRFTNGKISINTYEGVAVFVGADWVPARKRAPELYKTDYNERFQATNKNFFESIRGLAEPYMTSEELLRCNLADVALRGSMGETVRVVV